jgi:hypothetical protein
MKSSAASIIGKHFTKSKGTLFGKPRSQVVKHPGAFSASAHRAGKSTHAFAEEKKGASGTSGKRARLALAFEKMRAKK